MIKDEELNDDNTEIDNIVDEGIEFDSPDEDVEEDVNDDSDDVNDDNSQDDDSDDLPSDDDSDDDVQADDSDVVGDDSPRTKDDKLDELIDLQKKDLLDRKAQELLKKRQEEQQSKKQEPDYIEQLLAGKEVDVDATYPQVIKEFHDRTIQMRDVILDLQSQIQRMEQASSGMRADIYGRLDNTQYGQDRVQSAKKQATEYARSIIDGDPRDPKVSEMLNRVAYKKYNELLATQSQTVVKDTPKPKSTKVVGRTKPKTDTRHKTPDEKMESIIDDGIL